MTKTNSFVFRCVRENGYPILVVKATSPQQARAIAEHEVLLARKAGVSSLKLFKLLRVVHGR